MPANTSLPHATMTAHAAPIPTKPSNRAQLALGVAVVLAIVLYAVLLRPGTAAAAPHKVWSPLQSGHAKVIKPRHLGAQIATWYGPGFWGNRTGCGSTLRTNSWGVAHRTIPCGQLVWLRHKGREIAVPVIDRGPFSGATVDLTARTRTYLRFQQGSVRMSVLKRRIPVRRL